MKPRSIKIEQSNTNEFIIKHSGKNSLAMYSVTAKSEDEALRLYHLGSHLVRR